MAYTTIDDPSAHHQTKVYTGNGTDGQAYTFDGNSDMQPDWLWVKNRSNSGPYSGMIFDSSRGGNQGLFPDANSAQGNTAYGYVGAFQTDGFTVTSGSSGDERVNNNSDSYSMWGWKANGGTTSSNSDGSITSTVQVNSTAGFSIVTYTGNGTNNATVGHGLGSTPDHVVVKCTSTTGYWINNSFVWGTTDDGGPKNRYFNTTDVPQSDKIVRDFGSSTFTLSTSSASNTNTATYVAYCFKSIQGFSKISSYTGNGNADGPFVYTGFKPAWLLITRWSASSGSSTGTWLISDSERDPVNPTNKIIKTNVSDAENTGYWYVDYLSNGFKVRLTDAEMNGDGHKMFYQAYAEHPFVSSEGVPTTAR